MLRLATEKGNFTQTHPFPSLAVLPDMRNLYAELRAMCSANVSERDNAESYHMS